MFNQVGCIYLQRRKNSCSLVLGYDRKVFPRWKCFPDFKRSHRKKYCDKFVKLILRHGPYITRTVRSDEDIE